MARPEALRPRTPEWYAARWAADQEAFERRRYRGHFEFQRNNHEQNRRRDRAAHLRYAADRAYDEARWLISESRRLDRAGYRAVSDQLFAEGRDRERWCHRHRDLAEAVLAGTAAPDVVTVTGDDFEQINDDVGDLARGPVRTGDRSALTGDDHPPPIDRSRPYHRRGGLRPPLALHQRDVERQVPRRPDGTVVRTPDPRVGSWFGLVNDGGPQADPTRGINCVDCTLSLFETWVHGRPRVAAPRTFDAYALGDVTRPLNGEANGPGRIEDVTGGRFQRLCESPSGTSPAERASVLDTGYRNLRDQLLVGGHGSFAFVINQWEGGGSHIWVAVNQNGTILYLDPQSGEIADRPLGHHRGVPHPYNAVDADVLVLAGDGAPMPLAGLRRGLFSQRPDLPAYPPATEHQGYGEPYLNRLHVLASPGSAQPTGRAEELPADRRKNEREEGAAYSGPTGSRDASPSDPSAVTPAELVVLEGLRSRAADVADDVESALTAVGERVADLLRLDSPLRLLDREHRLKSLDSLERKFVAEAVAIGMPVDEFAEGVNDVLRFCMTLPDGDLYPPAATAVLDLLRAEGFLVADDACKNFWRSGNRFYGLNCTIQSPQGVTFELQMHTELSRTAWLETHGAYEILRRIDEPPHRRIQALLEMLAVNRQLGIPGSVPQGLDRHFNAKDASFAKWILTNAVLWQRYRDWLDTQRRSFRDVVRDHGLDQSDFPIAPEVAARLEGTHVELLRDL